MASVAVLSQTDLHVSPGEETTLVVTVRNTGTVVDEYSVTPLGDAAAWIVAEPAVLPLFPGAEGVFTVRIRPPRAPQTALGPVAFGLHVRSTEDPEGSVVEEGVLTVARFADTQVELMPRTSHARGRRAGRHEVAIDNRGNAPLTCTFSTIDDDGRVSVEVGALSVHVAPGEAAFVPVKVRAVDAFWRGPAMSHPFQVYVEPGTDPNMAVDGMFLQEAVLPKWLPRAVLALLALLALLTALWFAVLKPTIESTATEAAEQAAAEAAEKAAAEAAAPVQAAQASQQAQIDALTQTGGATPTEGTADPLGDPTAVRLVKGQQIFTVPADQVFSLTDVLFQNPNGDSGTVTLRRGGDVLFVERLENFRDLDQHFVAPVAVTGGQSLTLVIGCEAPGLGADDCTPAVLLSGFLRPLAPPA